MTNSWRALARMAQDRLVASTDPEDVTMILNVSPVMSKSLRIVTVFNSAVVR